MGEDERFEALAGATTSFSQLLFADDRQNDDASFGGLGSSSVFESGKTPQMLCFGERGVMISEATTPTKSSLTCSDSSSSASSAKSNSRKRGGEGKESDQCTIKAVGNASQRLCNSKKSKTESPNTTGPAKRKEKLGERIAALQQLVSPFGKTDTASVLHEAMGYIRFLQEQVQLLCSPYLQRFPNSLPLSVKEEGEGRKNLRSRGLCLVPVECTVHVADTNGADFWSPAMAGNVVSSSTTTKL